MVPTTKEAQRAELHKTIWRIANDLRGSVDGWDTGTHLAHAVARAGMDLAEMERDIARDPAAYDALIERHEAEQRAAGHWGVPLFVHEGEPFFGQDRMDLLRWRLGPSSHR